jgi:uncharacterized protein (DUF2132 family)
LHIAEEAGRAMANTAGRLAQRDWLAIVGEAERRGRLREYAMRYVELKTTKEAPQLRGIQFEKLWRDIVDTYGWHPKKFEIPGENNDFTAIYSGLHILAEVRWYQERMHGGQMREFIAKLDPRPQTIGLFISRSGYDKGAIAVVRRAVNSKTIVLFSRPEIESVIVAGHDPGPMFLERLREVYDMLLEGPAAPLIEQSREPR